MDKIKIKKLEVFARHGVFPEENEQGQTFIISAILYTDIRGAGKEDDLNKTIHYGEVSHMMKAYIEEHMFQLIETVVEGLAKKMLLDIPNLQKVTLEIEKPQAPIGLPLETVAVEITRKWHDVYIAIGSNIGDKEAYLKAGISALEDKEGCVVERISDFITTAPYGDVVQEDFLNGAIKIRTLLTPEELLECLHEIEGANQRERTIRWGPRTLDLDILFYDDLIVDIDELHIPHIELHKRDFVLRPLRQIAPNLKHPLIHKTVEQMLEELGMSC